MPEDKCRVEGINKMIASPAALDRVTRCDLWDEYCRTEHLSVSFARKIKYSTYDRLFSRWLWEASE